MAYTIHPEHFWWFLNLIRESLIKSETQLFTVRIRTSQYTETIL